MRTQFSQWFSIVLVVSAAQAWADARESVIGRWAGDRSILEISEHDGQLSARVIAMDDPVYLEGEEFGPVGAVRRDDLNPDVALRQQPMLGIELLSDYRFEGGKWQGRIYDPESGNVYSSNMRVARNGELKMRGYLGIAMFGRTASFVPLHTCTEHAKEMLALTSREARIEATTEAGLEAAACE